MQQTTNLDLKKPDYADTPDIQDINYNMDILDTEIPKKVDKVAGKGLSTEDYTTTEKNKLAGVEPGADVNPTANEILTQLKTVDGTGSGLDADLLDGKHASEFALKSETSKKTAHTSTPSLTDDINSGYKVGDYWINNDDAYANSAVYLCVDNTANQASWIFIGRGLVLNYYDNGTEYIPFKATGSKSTKGDTYLQLAYGWDEGGYFTSTISVDVSQINKIKIDWENIYSGGGNDGSAYFQVLDEGYSTLASVSRSDDFARRIDEVDVSGFTSNVYFRFKVYSYDARTTRAYKIWGEV